MAPRTRSHIWSVVLVALLCATPGLAQTSTLPWELLSTGFNGTIKSLDYAAASGTLFLGGDNGGVWRSSDGGEHWEPVNGGPGVTEGVRGGYDWGCPPGTSCEHGVVYGGPPSINVQDLTPMGVVSGPLPRGMDGDHLSLRLGRMWWSKDDGAQWYPLSPHCTGITKAQPPLGLRAGAIDAGVPGHLVVAGGSGVWGVDRSVDSADASSCPWGVNSNEAIPKCAQRGIAWTKDPSAQMKASFTASNQHAWDAPRQMDRAAAATAAGAGWHFASIAHLAAGTPAARNACSAGSLPPLTCAVDPRAFCHGAPPKPDAAPETACLSTDGCACADPPKDCRFPVVAGLAIDPRNGWTYAATQVGLLVSPDGGRTWGRSGDAALDRNGEQYVPDGDKDAARRLRLDAKVRLLTGIAPSTAAAENEAAAVGDGGRAYDLNRLPHRILDVGPVSLAATPQTCPLERACPQRRGACDEGHYADGRPRQHLRAYVSVDWRAADTKNADGAPLALSVEVTRSSVFVAEADACADPEAPLVFRDTATLYRDAAGAYTTDEFDTAANGAPGSGGHLALPKLPRSTQYAPGIGYHADAAHATCPLSVLRVAAAPSDSRIAYAVLVAKDSPPGGCPGICNGADGIYRTLDGGETWRLIASPWDPQWDGGPTHGMAVRSLVVSAQNPYVAWYLSDLVYRVEPAAGTAGQPKIDGCPAHAAAHARSATNCTACDAEAKCSYVTRGGKPHNNLLFDAHLDVCDKSQVVTDYCKQFEDHGATPAERLARVACGRPKAADMLAPPSCVHHFPSQPADAAQSLYGDAGASCVPCAADVATTQDTLPLNCCAVVHQVTTTRQAVCDKAGDSTVSAGRGGSEEGIYATAMIQDTTAGQLTTTFLTAAEDAPAAALGPAGKKTAAKASGSGVAFAEPKWHAVTPGGDVVAVNDYSAAWAAVPDQFQGHAGAWLLGSQGVSDSAVAVDYRLGFFSLAWLALDPAGGQPTAQVLGRIVPLGVQHVYHPFTAPLAMNHRQPPGHIRLLDGGSVLYVAMAGMGVYAVDKALAHGATFVPNPKHYPRVVQSIVPGVTFLGEFEGQDPAALAEHQAPGPAVQDMARDGLGHLFAVVGVCQLRTCTASVAPGLYVRNETELASKWRRVPSPDLADPYVLTLVRTPQPAAPREATLLVASWSQPPDDCGGGVYALPLTTANLRSLDEPAVAPDWRLLLRHDGIAALSGTDTPGRVLVGVTGQQNGNRVEHGEYLGLAPYPNGNPYAERGAVPAVAPYRPGVYEVEVAGGVPLPVVQRGVAETCDSFAKKLKTLPGTLADCDDRVHRACTPVAGATASADRPIVNGVPPPPVDPASKGLANSLLFPNAIEVSRTTGALIVAVWGNGAYFLPPQAHASASAYFQEGPAAAPAWTVRFQDLWLQYARPGLGVDKRAFVSLGGQTAGCPLAGSSAPSCLPGTGGMLRTLRFPLSANSMVSGRAEVLGADDVTLGAQHVVSSVSPLGRDLALRPNADATTIDVPPATDLARLRLHVATSAAPASLLLDNRPIAAQWQREDGEWTAVLSGFGWLPGAHTLVLQDAEAHPMAGLVRVETTLATPYEAGRGKPVAGVAATWSTFAPLGWPRRASAWLRVTLRDPAQPMRVRVNGHAWLAVAAGATTVNVLLAGEWLHGELVQIDVDGAGKLPGGNVVGMRLFYEVDEAREHGVVGAL